MYPMCQFAFEDATPARPIIAKQMAILHRTSRADCRTVWHSRNHSCIFYVLRCVLAPKMNYLRTANILCSSVMRLHISQHLGISIEHKRQCRPIEISRAHTHMYGEAFTRLSHIYLVFIPSMQICISGRRMFKYLAKLSVVVIQTWNCSNSSSSSSTDDIANSTQRVRENN